MSENTKGILCLTGALVFLTISDSIIKWLSPHYALHQIMLFRAFFALLVVLVFVASLENAGYGRFASEKIMIRYAG